MRLTLAMVFTMLFLSLVGTRTVNEIMFDRGCEGYLKRAADANTVELAIKNLEVAINYTEANGMTSGYTSALYRTPDEDVGFWHENLRSSLQELRTIKPETTQLEKTNVLIKLRETLLDHNKDGVKVTSPSGISIYPNNVLFAWWGWLSFIFAALFWGLLCIEYD